MTNPDEQSGVIEPADLPPDFEVFFTRHMREFARIAGARLRDPHDADEALMAAALVMFRKWPRILAHANPIALAHRILDDSITDFYRRRARTAEREVTHGELSYADLPTADDLMLLRGHDRLDRALADLEERAPLQAELPPAALLGRVRLHADRHPAGHHAGRRQDQHAPGAKEPQPSDGDS